MRYSYWAILALRTSRCSLLRHRFETSDSLLIISESRAAVDLVGRAVNAKQRGRRGWDELINWLQVTVLLRITALLNRDTAATRRNFFVRNIYLYSFVSEPNDISPKGTLWQSGTSKKEQTLTPYGFMFIKWKRESKYQRHLYTCTVWERV